MVTTALLGSFFKENFSSWMAGHELHTKKFSLIGKTDDIICSKKKQNKISKKMKILIRN